MNKEVRLVKDYLRSEFPQDKFFVKLFKAQNYNFTADRLEIVTRLPYDKVCGCLKNVVSGVTIFPKGKDESQNNNTKANILGYTETTVRAIEIVVL